MSWKLIGGIAGAVVFAFLIWAAQDRFRLADIVDDARACAAAVDTPGAEDLGRCVDQVKLVAAEAHRGRACEAAIGGSDLYAERASCGEQVKRRGAELGAARADNQDLRNQLTSERQGRAAAIARAEGRAAEQVNRRSNQDAVIQNLPRDPAGRVRCDAECLRRLAEPPPGPRP